jgi:hypothetical protein
MNCKNCDKEIVYAPGMDGHKWQHKDNGIVPCFVWSQGHASGYAYPSEDVLVVGDTKELGPNDHTWVSKLDLWKWL